MAHVFDLTINSKWEDVLKVINQFDVSFGISDGFWETGDELSKNNFLALLTRICKSKVKDLLEQRSAKMDGISVQSVTLIETNPADTILLDHARIYLCKLVQDNSNELTIIKNRNEITNVVSIVDITNLYTEK